MKNLKILPFSDKKFQKIVIYRNFVLFLEFHDIHLFETVCFKTCDEKYMKSLLEILNKFLKK